MWILPQHAPEEGAAGGQNHLVGLHLVIITSKSYVKEVFVVSQFSEGNTDVALKVIPTETELFCPHPES